MQPPDSGLPWRPLTHPGRVTAAAPLLLLLPPDLPTGQTYPPERCWWENTVVSRKKAYLCVFSINKYLRIRHSPSFCLIPKQPEHDICHRMCTRQPCEEVLYEDYCRLRDDQHVGTGGNVWCPHQQLRRNLSLIPELSIFPRKLNKPLCASDSSLRKHWALLQGAGNLHLHILRSLLCNISAAQVCH